MKTLRIRKWMIIGIALVMAFPWWVYMIVHMWNGDGSGSWPGQMNQAQNRELAKAQSVIVEDYPDWHSPSFSSNLENKLKALQVEATVIDSNGKVVFDNHEGRPWMHNNSESVILENGHKAGTVKLYARAPFDAFAFVSAAFAMVFAIFLVRIQIKRNIISPLESMSHAARQIACGDLDFRLASTRVREIAQVRTAFYVMRDGLKASVEQQAKLEDERRFFIGAIAHDLRTPLFALRGYLEGLRHGIANSPEKTEKYLSKCQEKSDQLDRLVSDLFAFTKLEYMEQSLQKERTDFKLVIERAVDSIEPLAQEKKGKILVEMSDVPLFVEGDPHLLERALCNIFDNAMRYTPSGGEITVCCHIQNTRICFSVLDNGPGFSSVDLENVFHPLYRGEISRNRETGGAGLGLTISRRIIKAHGGDLHATNHSGGGAEVSGWIPAMISDL